MKTKIYVEGARPAKRTGLIDVYYEGRGRYNFPFLKGNGVIYLIPRKPRMEFVDIVRSGDVSGPEPVRIKNLSVGGKPFTLINDVHIEDLMAKQDGKGAN